jgi:predicted small metal-binding protein
MWDLDVVLCMATSHTPQTTYHACSCGEEFETTEELLEHAREEHGLAVF